MRKLIEKTTIRPQTTVVSLTPGASVSNIPPGALGYLPVGYYRGAPAFWDLDKAVIQPLVEAESRYILQKLDGRLAGFDLTSVAIPALAVVGVSARARLTVPAGMVFYLQAIRMLAAVDGASGYSMNWRCSLWPDNLAATPDADGQAFYAVDVAGAAKTATPATALFGVTPTALLGATPATADLPLQFPRLLRLPAGAVITFQSTVNTAPTTLALPSTLALYGYVGKLLAV